MQKLLSIGLIVLSVFTLISPQAQACCGMCGHGMGGFGVAGGGALLGGGPVGGPGMYGPGMYGPGMGYGPGMMRGGFVQVRVGGLRGVLFGRVARGYVMTPYGPMAFSSRRGGLRGLIFGGVDRVWGPGGGYAVARFGGARGVLFGRSYRMI